MLEELETKMIQSKHKILSHRFVFREEIILFELSHYVPFCFLTPMQLLMAVRSIIWIDWYALHTINSWFFSLNSNLTHCKYVVLDKLSSNLANKNAYNYIYNNWRGGRNVERHNSESQKRSERLKPNLAFQLLTKWSVCQKSKS